MEQAHEAVHEDGYQEPLVNLQNHGNLTDHTAKKIEQGKIIEQGSHDQLINNDGIYAKLWAHQSGGFLGREWKQRQKRGLKKGVGDKYKSFSSILFNKVK